MKALTNILNYILLLLMILIASCTEDTAEVDDLVRGEEYVTVRMQVPGMKTAATRADEAEDNLTSVVVLVYRNDALVSKTEVTTASSTLTTTTSTTGTFNIPRPKSGDVIHFLGNLPETVKNSLPATGGTQEEVLCALTTSDDENLSYWGTATYTSSDVIDNVTLYRNMAKVEIAAGPNCTFPEDRLFIAGLVKPIEKGTLVPYKDGFNFNLNDNDYYTLPSSLNDPASRTNNQLLEPAKSLYIFEHDNPGTANGLYVICEIDEDYYKVALIDEKGEPYPIIRNHRYVIYVNDLDEGAERFDIAASPETKPYNFEVREYKDVTLTLLPSSVTLDYTKSNPSASKLSLTVGGIKNVVETLTFDAPGFTIQPGDGAAATAENGVFKITNTSKESIGFTFTLTDPDIVESISVTGAGKYVNEITPASTTVTLNLLKESIEVTPTTSTLYYDSDEPQVVTVNVTVPDGVKTLSIGGAEKFEVMQGDNPLTATEGVYSYTVTDNSNPIPFTFTLNPQNVTETQTITFSDPTESVNSAEVAITMAATPTVTFSPDESSKTMSVNDTYTVTMIVPNSGTLTALNIASEGFTVTASGGSLSGPTDNVYNYTGGTTQFTFTPTSAGSRTIRFYGGEGVDINVSEKSISVTVNAAITATATPNTIYYDGNDKSVTVNVTIPKGVTGLNISAANFNYGEDTDGIYTYDRTDGATTETTVQLVFTLKDGVTADSSITFSDASGNTCVTGAEVDIDVEATPVQTNTLTVTPLTSTTIDLSGSGNSTVQLRLAIPSDLSYLRINTDYAFTVSALNGYTQPRSQAPNYYYDYITPGSVSTIDLEFTMSADYIFEVAGEYPITFYAAQNSSEGITTTITVVNENLDDGVIWEGSKTATNSGYILKYTSFSEYRGSGKKLKIDVTSTSGGWKQFSIKYEGDNNNLGALEGNTIDSTLSIDIPEDDRDIVISGQGGITITKIYVE